MPIYLSVHELPEIQHRSPEERLAIIRSIARARKSLRIWQGLVAGLSVLLAFLVSKILFVNAALLLNIVGAGLFSGLFVWIGFTVLVNTVWRSAIENYFRHRNTE